MDMVDANNMIDANINPSELISTMTVPYKHNNTQGRFQKSSLQFFNIKEEDLKNDQVIHKFNHVKQNKNLAKNYVQVYQIEQ
jgi:hypothetical protein